MFGQFSIDGIRIEYGFSVEPKAQSRPWVVQVHGTSVLNLTDPSAVPEGATEGDAVITSLRGKEIHVFTADCVPILLAGVDPEGDSHTAAIHSGWRGTMRGVVPEVLRRWPIPLTRTVAIVGPAIGACHFEVKQDFIEEFSKSCPRGVQFLEEREGKKFFNLPEFVISEQLKGIPDTNIHTRYQLCTYCSEPALPSYRRNRSTDPQIRAWIRTAGINYN
jgi:polyphenol oxidase